ncbi:guanosine-5'-triphosphate,3'-diphosphate diphosphatase [Pseudoalteromonas rubra]|uniref:Guanosine-5'-triphosphate,3'-diphosphate pyrophosphatase n=1 Tax=Pseudoalteromonas rubra TaxID=43658 RepID=A0A0U2Z7D9_9GAMM|nr:guanosine-3',5'-bis(diphosphate) 3'-pyrophosphohydrolase [Pseudoalteromonas rubra]
MVQRSPHENVYAVIDLGSNSFHMLIAKHMAGGVHTIGRVKRKVRLAAGLDEQNLLSEEAMQRGWECLSLFAERLQDIPANNIRIVATATLRLATNADVFKHQAEQILGHPISIISGEEEALSIYKGVAHTSACQGRQLVVDIGGASTEIVIGQGFEAQLYHSLNMGCVTYLERYFSDGALSEANFSAATSAAHEVVAPYAAQYKSSGWELAIGASGTVQAIQEIFAALGLDEMLTLDKLQAIRAQAIQFESIEQLELPGLSEERRLVFVSGLAILIALFEALQIEQMGLAGGALREGILYSMIDQLNQADIRKRTLDGFMSRYHVDTGQATRVFDICKIFLQQLKAPMQFDFQSACSLLHAAASMHEIGLVIDYKSYHLHSAYILKHTGMPGYSRVQKQMVVTLVGNHRLDVEEDTFIQFGHHQGFVELLVRIFRVAVILSMRRQDDVLPDLYITATEPETLTLTLPDEWLHEHPLMRSELELEAGYQEKAGWILKIERD